ncbi:prephenate dehydrogenase [Streptomyces roseochromogenus]|uniref:prephenate dehydrogenase n=1 Tax=Streptomyces roseochromogenus TaxID=285450 RepID=UPI0004CF65EB
MRTVTVIGTGLIGTSIALALTAHGVRVHLADRNPVHAKAAQDMGAGTTKTPSHPVDLAVIAVPPDHVAATLYACQQQNLARAYTDVASVKTKPALATSALGCDMGTYLGSHPMAGRERSGPQAAKADLFEGRPWVMTPDEETHPDTLIAVREVIALCGAVPVVMTPAAHDRAVALVSHAPHVMAALMAARLQHADTTDLKLTGQGLRDVTRIAAGHPALWVEILAANAGATADVLEGVAADLEEMIAALRMASVAGSDACVGKRVVIDLLSAGQAGRERLPGKHGGPHTVYESMMVHVGDQPGELARLLACASDAGINIEDMAIDHTAAPSGIVELMVGRGNAARLSKELGRRGWRCEQAAPA